MLVPKLRFPNYLGDWKKSTIGESGEFYYGRSCPKWSVTEDATIPCIRYGELYTKFENKIDKVYSYTSIEPDNLRFSKGTEVLVPRVGEDPMDYTHCAWLSLPNVAIGEMISVYNTDNNPLFTALMFNAKLRTEFAKRVEGGSVTNLYYEKLRNIVIYYPTALEEQQKIADFLSTVDEVIAQSEAEVQNLEQQKKAAMQKIFSQEVRFKREDGTEYPEWEEQSFKRLYKKVIEKNDLSFSVDSIISVANMYFKGADESADSTDDYMRTYNIFRLGDIAFEGHINKQYSCGRFVANDIGDGIVSHIFDVFRPIASMCLGFWKYYINYEPIMKHILVRCTKSSTMMNNLVASEFLDQVILVPCLEEQQKIADFLSDYDEAISYAKQELDKWKELKKGLLQQMFV